MYHDYFGLQEQAFSIAVNPRYLYMSQQHKEALAHLLYGVNGGGFVMLSGEVGTGKTTIIRCLLEQLPENTEVAIILNPMSNINEMLATICDEMRIDYDKTTLNTKSLTDALQSKLLDNHKVGKNTVLLIDEAQLLSADVLEQIRLLTNLETASQKLLQIILVGQPELNDLLNQPRLRQLSQRIMARFHLEPLTLEETQAYIDHRLKVAGMQEGHSPFSPRIIKRIHQFSGGIPRLINVLCERTLIGAYGHNKQEIDSDVLDLAQKEVSAREGHKRGFSLSLPFKIPTDEPWLWPVAAGGGFFLLLIIVVATIQMLGPNTEKAEEIVASPEPETLVEATQTPEPTPTDEPADIDEDPAQPEIGKLEPEIETQEIPIATVDTDYYIRSKTRADGVLIKYLGFILDHSIHPCWQINTQGYVCDKIEFETWDEFKELNKPAVLKLTTPERFVSHAVIIGIQRNSALLLDEDGQQLILSLETLGKQWTGEVFFVWRKPENFKQPLRLGSTDPIVAEIAQSFAVLDGQATPITNRRFNRSLQDRIKIFQRSTGLDSDGVLGERTIMKLNEALGLSTQLIRNF